MIKVKLFDCCGAYHIYGFGSPTSLKRIGTTHGDHTITEAEWLQLQSSHGQARLSRWPAEVYVPINNPGLLTCVLTGYQNMQWAPYLRKFGWTLTSNNANNSNSNNDLFFWIKVCRTANGVRPANYQEAETSTRTGVWTLDGKPYTGPIRFKDNGEPYRVRNARGELRNLMWVVSGRTSARPEVPAEALPLMRGNS